MPDISVRVLGALTVIRDGEPVALGGPLPRALLARLVMARGHMVPDATLIDDLWSDSPPRSAQLTLQGYVASLRKALEPERGRSAPAVLVRRGTGYALAIDPQQVDAGRFETLAEAGRDQLAAGHVDAARTTLAEALELWWGPAYADAAKWDFAANETVRLERLRDDALEDHLAARSECGEHAAVIAQLEAIVAADPLRERAWELLALAQYRAGKQGDALASLRTARERVADELGADPRQSLLDLQSAILNQDSFLMSGAPATRAAAENRPADNPERPTGNIPLALTSLVGRVEQINDITDLVAEHRLVTLIGPGGMGKTRAALEVARERKDVDGPWLAELAGAQNADAVLDTVVSALGLTLNGGIPVLTSILHDRDFLLVLDNCEHLLDEVSVLATAILRTCPRVRILATSREALGVAGEVVFDMPPLADSAELFLERAGSAAADATADEVETLCSALDHIPLAIELAAGQSATLSVRQIIDMLDDRFAILRGGPRTNKRHATMQAAIDGSYQSLTERERQLFCDLAVFNGGFDLDAAKAVTGHRGLLSDLSALIDKSMLKALGGDPRRYLMLETLRSYAQVQQDPERAASLRRAHITWVLATATDAYLGLRGPRCLQWTRRLDAEMADVRAALDLVDPHSQTYLEIVGNVYWFWFRRGFADEGMRMLEPAVDAPADVPIATRTRALAGRAIMSYLGADLPSLFAALTRLGEVYSEFDLTSEDRVEQVARGDAAVTLAFFEAGSGLIDPARVHANVALTLGRRYDSPWTVAEALMSLGTADFRAGDHSSAGTHLEAAVAAGRDCGYDWLAASALWIHAKSDIAQEKLDGSAERKLAQMVGYCERAYDLTSWMVALFTLAYTLFRRGLHEHAGRLIGVVDNMTELTGYSPEKMDVVELAAFGSTMRSQINPEILARESLTGSTLTRDEVRDLVHEWAGSTVIS
ncbi:BTAD domain-containing putative transcriptional regulator [Nocardia sp. 348MFTsu5.1]|uniref:BTAD domain-containing putative transcriptional regulator n=1 Tax=Nocardia sp. 348MFTsu5.1 TaxID=1172185 RepID=UPI0003769B5E|nr:BTAD domain-containing putative transcriptional regulator [Nocardia sp. 348MFTsu5.1]